MTQVMLQSDQSAVRRGGKMSDAGPIFVAGLGRCGSSLVMQMLSAADLPCLGEYPSFEISELGEGRDIPALLAQSGVAMKIINPHDDQWPARFDASILWLSRNTREQAKSQIKLLRMGAGFDIPGQAWRAVEKSLRTEKWQCVEWWNRCNREPLFLRFEDILAHPVAEAKRIAEYVGVSIGAMPDCVKKRTPRCQPDMRIELGQIAEGA